VKESSHRDPNKVLEYIHELEKNASMPSFELNRREDIQVKIRTDESVGPGKFKVDPFIPGGYIANSLTIKAMRPDIFVLGDSLDDLSVEFSCSCGEVLDIQFWKLCPHCGREVKP
jgi:hypothetical protein